MDERSAIAKLCRARCYPPRATRLYQMTRCLPNKIKHDLLPLCQSAVTAGFLLQVVLMAPLSKTSIEDTYTASMIKEMNVMCSIKRECTVDFGPYFGEYYRGINEMMSPNPEFARHVHMIIDSWVDNLTKKILYPKLGSKTVSKTAANSVKCIDNTYVPESEVGITPIDLERIYHEHGIKVGGACEMRQKWYCSNLNPRTYYTQGGIAYHSTKYLSNPFIELCDYLPSTNRRTRVDPGRIQIRKETYDVAYYDLSSFTSNLHIQADFLTRLAKYCEGTEVTILDSVHGLIKQDLGEMIHAYVEHNLIQPTYTIPSKYGDPTQEHVHNVAGFLGVYGNIATATFIHGIIMGMRHQYLDENNVAGDDGLDVTDDIDVTLGLVSLMGIVHKTKTHVDSEGCCIHLKRPIERIGTRLLHRILITWPSLEPGETDCDIRYPYLRDKTKREKKDAMAGSITAFLRKLEGLYLDDNEKTLIDRFVTMVYSTYNLPIEGFVPQITGGLGGFVPAYDKRYIGLDPIYNTISRSYTDIVMLPIRERVEFKYGMLEEETFRCNSVSLLRHLIALGYVDYRKVSMLHFGEEGMQQLLKEYKNPDPCIYEYTVLRRLPSWIIDFSFLI